MSSFVHLRCHSAYSLAEGAMHPKALVKLAKANDMPALAVTDTNNLFGALEFAGAAADAGVQPITGLQISMARPGEQRSNGPAKAPDQLVLLAQNAAGYKNLMKLSSKLFLEGGTTAEPQLRLDELQGHTEGLICLTGGPQGTIGRLLGDGQGEAAEQILLVLKQIFKDRLYIELQRHNLPIENKIEPGLLALAYKHDLPLVATNDCYFADEGMYEAHDALLCIAQGTLVVESNRRKVTPDHRFKTAAEMRVLFADLPEAVDNTLVIAQRCAYMPKKGKPILPGFPTEAGRNEAEELAYQAKLGLEARIAKNGIAETEPYYKQLDYELGVINGMGFPGYFLIVSDFIKWAKANDIPVGPGRGSGASSVVAWALTITDVDPLRWGLIFERFLNPERVSMPDFDIDFCQERRDEVISYVQQRYGREKVAQIITFGKLQARAVLRDVGRVMGLPWGQVDKLCKLVPNNPANPVTLVQALDAEPALRDLVNAEESNQRLFELAKKLEGLYRHASTHAGGVIIGDRTLDEIVALYRDPRSDMPVTQFHFKDAEKVGLVKFDFLGLKTLSVIKRAIDIIRLNDGISIDLQTLPLDDKKSYELLGRAEVLGVFQVESAGMRDILRQMKPDRLEDMIALVALYRPGPMDSIPDYIAVKNGKQKPDYMHPLMEPVLKSTYGVLVYQEQVMEAARRLAGYTLGGADLLRRAMGKKIKSEMDAQRAIFLDGCKKNNVADDVANLIFDKMEKFSSYGFNIGHAAPYALIAYQTAYLKANHPAEFMAASMTYEIGNTDKLGAFRMECDRMGMKLLPPDINFSFADFAVEKLPDGTKAVRYALGAIKGVGAEAMRLLVREREENGKFKDWADLFRRMDLRAANRKTLESLIKAGALDGMNPNRAQMITAIDLMQAYGQSAQEERASGQNSLFGVGSDMPTPQLPKAQTWDAMQKLQEEFSAIGFFLSAHPLDQYRNTLARLMVVSSADLARKARGASMTRFRVAGVVLSKQERVSKNGNRFAFVSVSDSAGVFEMTVFSEVLATQREYLEAGRRIVANVDVQLQEEDVRLTCFSLEPLEAVLDRVQSGLLLKLSSADSLSQLHSLIEASKGGKRAVSILIDLGPEQEIEITLPGNYQLTQEDQARLSKLPGVDEIQTL
jgi:DNA polymerase III subunit alpha